MHPDRWRRIEDLFHAALEFPPGDRRRYLTDACDGEDQLRSEVQALLDQSASDQVFLETPALDGTHDLTTEHTGCLVEIGERISHYQILERLGQGGMGVVYKAQDLRLKRVVALKFLHDPTDHEDAKRRLVHEAQAASALDHPHICGIHEIDETPAGQLFIAMSYYEGETLAARIARGPLDPADAVAIAVQIAQAAAAAHDAGIVHRDIKPGNIILTRGDHVKLLDFGIAKLESRTRVTRAGITVGTVAYMAPELLSGREADPRSDVWSIGVVLFEMLTGKPPFSGPHEPAIIHAIVNQAPPRVRERRPEIPAAIDRVVARALAKVAADRFDTANALSQALRGLRPSAATRDIDVPHGRASRRRMLALVALLLLVGTPAAWWLNRQWQIMEARNRAVPEIRKLLAEDRYVEGLRLANETDRVLRDDATLAQLRDQLSQTREIQTSPSGARVSIRDAALKSDWQVVGTTPLRVQWPRGVLRWKFEAPGWDTTEFIMHVEQLPPSVAMSRSGELPPRMLRIPSGNLTIVLTGYDTSKTIQATDYLIDRFEVTSREFKEFVDAGGYSNARYWKHPFVKDGSTIGWADAMALFRDQTGRPGPATWEVGTFPHGREEDPVSGVSWYEAAAYAEFRGKSLPTVYHWTRAAGTSFAAQITPASNIGGSELQPVGRSQAVSNVGMSDMAGNVKEWAWNEHQPGVKRFVLGGAWNEPEYMFLEGEARSPFDRSPSIGFRCALYPKPESAPAATFAAVTRVVRDYSAEKPPPDAVVKVYKERFSYDATPIDARSERVDNTSPLWRREKVSFAAAYGKDRVTAHLFLPKRHTPPYQLVMYWPASGVIRQPASDLMDTSLWDFLVTSGRAVLVPVYYGTFERKDPTRQDSWPDLSRSYRDWVVKQVQDARRGLDYAATRADLRRDAVGFLGVSWGGRMGPVLMAVDARVQAAVLGGGGLSPGLAPPEVDGFTFAAHVAAPVLMFNGASDIVFELEHGQKPLFRALGTPAARKRHVVLPGGHGAFVEKRSQFIRETLDWFDRYLGSTR